MTDPADNPGYQAAAKMFVADLSTNVQMRNDWSRLLAQIAAAIKAAPNQAQKDSLLTQAVQACDNFLVAHGYKTTGKDVLDLIKSPFWEDHLKANQPNADSDRFVQQLLRNAGVFKAWNGLLLQVSQSEKTVDDLNAYLKTNGFNCTLMQVNASFVKMRNHQLTYWSGTFDTYIQQLDDDGNPAAGTKLEPGPTLIIDGPGTVQLVGDESSTSLVRKLNAKDTTDITAKGDPGKFVYSNGTLVWEPGPSGIGVAAYGGNVVFSEITRPTTASSNTGSFSSSTKADDYTGPMFTGMLTVTEAAPFDPFKKTPPKVTKYQVLGQLAPDPNAPQHKDNVPAHDPTLREKIAKWLGYAIIGFTILKTLWSMGKKYTTPKEFQKDSDVFDDQINKANTEGKSLEQDLAGDDVSPVENLDFADSDVLQDLREQVAQATDDEAKAEAQQRLDDAKQAEDEFDDTPNDETKPDGDGWGGEMDDIPFEW